MTEQFIGLIKLTKDAVEDVKGTLERADNEIDRLATDLSDAQDFIKVLKKREADLKSQLAHTLADLELSQNSERTIKICYHSDFDLSVEEITYWREAMYNVMAICSDMSSESSHEERVLMNNKIQDQLTTAQHVRLLADFGAENKGEIHVNLNSYKNDRES